MKIEIIRGNELRREVWTFTLFNDYSRQVIWFDSYAIEVKESTRKKLWHNDGIWTRLMRRENTIQSPPLPPNVEAEMRENFISQVKQLPIER